jgi:hypothetical protein
VVKKNCVSNFSRYRLISLVSKQELYKFGFGVFLVAHMAHFPIAASQLVLYIELAIDWQLYV